jgi:beta-xylosidase
VAILVLAPVAAASAWALSYQNPLRNPKTGRPLSCPDPSVTYQPTATISYALVCTSGFDANAFPIYVSRDLVHWRADGFVFPRGHQPSWAVPSTGRHTGGRYWAPQINRLDGHWIVYYAAEYDAAKIKLKIPGQGPVKPNEMIIGYATSNSLAGPWRNGIVHYAGQFNNLNSQPEALVPAIDPSLLQDPISGQLYLFWSDQPAQIWAGQLSPTGTTLEPQIGEVLQVSEPFECDPRDGHCTVEAPEPFFAFNSYYLLFSGASTWDSSYAVGVASASSPLGPYTQLGNPILSQGNGFYSTGHTSVPVLGPDGNPYILYHARLRSGVQRPSDTRYLMLGRVSWANGWPSVSDP